MRSLTRRGATLVELTVALSLSAVMAVFLLGEAARQQRVVQGMAVRSAGFSTLETAAQVFQGELGGADPGDLVTASPERVVYRATRATGTSCGLSSDGVRLIQAEFRGLRVPVPGRDSLALPVQVTPSTWRMDYRPITGPLRSEVCPDGSAGLVIPASTGAAVAGVPLRVFEVMELRFYLSGGSWWLGARSVSAGESIQPVAGPFGWDGFLLELLDADGTATSDPLQARLVRARLATESGDGQALGGSTRTFSRRDSLTVLVRLGTGGT